MIEIRNPDEVAKIGYACEIVAETLRLLEAECKPGTSTARLDELAVKNIRKMGGEPAFLGYRGYPSTICASLNEEIVHGIPSKKRILRNGDILSIDLGCVRDGYFGDAAVTVPVGEVRAERMKLVKTTREALDRALAAIRDGVSLGDIGFAIEKRASESGMAVVRNYTGHGIGRNLHEEPSIPNFGTPSSELRIYEGMTLAIEPMICMGRSENKVLEDGWTVVTEDGSCAAHFEHTILVEKNGCRILTETDE